MIQNLWLKYQISLGITSFFYANIGLHKSGVDFSLIVTHFKSYVIFCFPLEPS